MADRRSTSKQLQSRSSIRSSNPNVFSDDYALEEYEPVANGRPPLSSEPAETAPYSTTIITTTTTTTPPPPPPPQRSLSVQQALESPHGSMRRSRLSQRSVGQESTASRFDDGASGQSVSDLGRTVSTRHRSVRTISSFGLPRAQSPYQGPTGPSQPYGMYSQDVSLARSPSVATTSTIRPPERAYSGPDGPTQPYGMYSQNTVPEDGQEVADVATAMPGFPSITQPQTQAVRRLGPDGEDADDLIGPDGYTEQLPPYSRYANGIPPKVDSSAASFVSHPLPQFPSQVTQEIAQAGPSEYYRPEPREVVSGSPVTANPFDDSSAVSDSTTALSSPPHSEKGTVKERVKRGGNKRVCCGLLPCWALAFVVVVLCAAILLGGIIGGIVARHTAPRHFPPPSSYQPQQANDPVTVTTTTLADASPIPTPSNLPALPTGAYTYVLDNPVAGQNTNSCLPPSQSNAWDCATGADLSINVTMQGSSTPLLSIGCAMTSDPQMPNPPNPQIRYGAQPPSLPAPVNMNLMRDKYNLDDGPAYFFQQTYNKTVILKAQDLAIGSQRSKRSAQDWSLLEERGQSSWGLNEFVNIADRPWYCFWNGTFLEGFIYVTQKEGSPSASNVAAASSFASATPTGSASKGKRQAGLATAGTTYPKVIKIEERRPVRNPPQPYCQQMQIMNGGQPAPYEPNGQPIIVNLTESEPPTLAQQQLQAPPPPSPNKHKDKRQSGPISKCVCEWRN